MDVVMTNLYPECTKETLQSLIIRKKTSFKCAGWVCFKAS